MLRFSSFIRSVKNLIESAPKDLGTYVAVYPDEDSIGRLCDLCMKLDLSDMMASHKLHATVLYSRKEVSHWDDAEDEVADMLPIEAEGYDLHLFDQQDGRKCLVLGLKSTKLAGLHHLLKRDYGGTHDYPDYKPHVTLLRDLPSTYEIPEINVCVPLLFTRHKMVHIDEDAT